MDEKELAAAIRAWRKEHRKMYESALHVEAKQVKIPASIASVVEDFAQYVREEVAGGKRLPGIAAGAATLHSHAQQTRAVIARAKGAG